MAQDISLFSNQVVTLLEKTGTEWRLEKKRIHAKRFVYLRWRRAGKAQVDVLLELCDSPEEASSRLEWYPDGIEDGGFKIRVSKKKLQNLGNDSYVWKRPDENIEGVSFRRGRVVAHVSSKSAKAAERFAQPLYASLPAT
jgi:hypothetical protein